MRIAGNFAWGTIAKFALLRHYRNEVMPYAVRRGDGRDRVKDAAHVALDRVFDAAWPTPPNRETDG